MSLINKIIKEDKGSQSIVTIPCPRYVDEDGIYRPVQDHFIQGTIDDYKLDRLDKAGIVPSEIDVQGFSRPSALEFSDTLESSFIENEMFNEKVA